MHKTLTLTLLALALFAGTAAAVDIGVGAYGGVNVPVLNDLSKQGTDFGIRVPVKLIPLLTVEPFWSKSSLGDAEEDIAGITYTRDGGDLTGFGANALLTFGAPMFQFFPFAGIGSYKLERDGAEDVSDVGYSFGLGLGTSLIPKLSLSVRGELDMVITDETSQKFAKVTAGAAYSFFSLP
jgi:hypothetical protein